MSSDRYRSSIVANDTDSGFRKISSTIYPKIEDDENDIYIYSNVGDRLDLLAYRYYGDVTLWWIIAQANHIGKGTLNIDPGTQLRIPQNLGKIFSDLDTVNKAR